MLYTAKESNPNRRTALWKELRLPGADMLEMSPTSVAARIRVMKTTLAVEAPNPHDSAAISIMIPNKQPQPYQPHTRPLSNNRAEMIWPFGLATRAGAVSMDVRFFSVAIMLGESAVSFSAAARLARVIVGSNMECTTPPVLLTGQSFYTRIKLPKRKFFNPSKLA